MAHHSALPWWRRRLVWVSTIFVIIIVAHVVLGLEEYFSLNNLRHRIASAGVWGVLLFFCMFTVGQVLHIPGMLFVVVAALVYGPVMGLVVAFTGALIAVSTTFVLVRGIGKDALAELDRPLINKLLRSLADHPIRTVALLRLIFWMVPPVNYALAMTPLRVRQHLVGSALGLLLPITGVVLFADWFQGRFIH